MDNLRLGRPGISHPSEPIRIGVPCSDRGTRARSLTVAMADGSWGYGNGFVKPHRTSRWCRRRAEGHRHDRVQDRYREMLVAYGA